MLDSEQITEVTVIVDRSLDRAERIWGEHGFALDEQRRHFRADADLHKGEVVPSRIPGHRQVASNQEQVGTFIALVADLRDSSKHLMSVTAGAAVQELQRVFYETSALLPALEKTISYKSGSVTEYLGDGLLGLFAVNEGDKRDDIRRASRAAQDCMGQTRAVVNNALSRRYNLPPLDLGIGLSMSRAVVSLVGLEGNSHAKAIGRCVYFATKLASGTNQIIVDERLYEEWPITKGGSLRFERCIRRKVNGYILSRKPD